MEWSALPSFCLTWIPCRWNNINIRCHGTTALQGRCKELPFSADRIIPDQSGGSRPAPGTGSSCGPLPPWISSPWSSPQPSQPMLASPSFKVPGLQGTRTLLGGDGGVAVNSRKSWALHLGSSTCYFCELENMDSSLGALVSMSKRKDS